MISPGRGSNCTIERIEGFASEFVNSVFRHSTSSEKREPGLTNAVYDKLTSMPETISPAAQSAAEYAEMSESRDAVVGTDSPKKTSAVLDSLAYVKEQEEIKKLELDRQRKIMEARKKWEEYKDFIMQNGIPESAIESDAQEFPNIKK